MHATSLGSAIFPDDWHCALKVARREPIAHCTCAGGKAFIRVGPPANSSAKVSTKIRSKPCQSAASSVAEPRVFLGVLGIAEAPAMQERRPWMLEGEPEPWHTSHH